MKPVKVLKYLKESNIEDLKKDLQKAADDHFYHNMDDKWGHEGFEREEILYDRIQNIVKDLEDKGVKVYHKDFDGTEKPGYQMGYEIVFKESDNNECKWVYVSKHGLGPGTIPNDIEISDVHDDPNSFSTVFCSSRELTDEELSKYELKPLLKDKVNESDERVSEIDLVRVSADEREYDLDFYDKLQDLGYEYILNYEGKVFYRNTKGDDDIIIIDCDHGNIIKVDHNGESLFFTDEEAQLLKSAEE